MYEELQARKTEKAFETQMIARQTQLASLKASTQHQPARRSFRPNDIRRILRLT